MGNTNNKPAQKANGKVSYVVMGNNNANAPQKDIIIKCSIEEMMRAFFKDYAIVWHDPNVNSQENQQYIIKLKRFCEVFTFTEWQKAKDYIEATQALCHVITSGTNGESFVKETCMSQSVANIYIFCANKEYHSTWAQNYPKVSCIETKIETVLTKIEQNLLAWYKEASSLKLSLPAFAPIFNDSDKSEMNHLHHFLKIIPHFQNREQAKEDFLTLSKKIYSDQENAKLIVEFKNTYNQYNKEQTLRWYTRESFVYKVTNNCLRIATSDSIQYSRLMLKEIQMAIKAQYRAKSKNFGGMLYRGAYLSQEEWSHLKENQDKEIEMHGFLSVSKEKSVALNFMKTDPTKKVFITIIVPNGPNVEEQGFAEIEEFSNFPQEKEILFNVRSRFTVLEAEDDFEYSGTSKFRHLVLLYGAQGFRQRMVEKNPIQDVSILDMESVSCAHCSVRGLEMPEKVLFISFAGPQKQAHYCKACISYGVSPFLCVPITAKPNGIKIKGYLLKMNPSQEQGRGQGQIPFYGYKCCNCLTKKQKDYFICTDCDSNKNKWCESCFEKVSTCRDKGQHNIILETSPFSFWCQRMSASESGHLKFQKELIEESAGVFQQAKMYFESYKYEKAIEYFTLYIQEYEPKGKDVHLALSYNNMGVAYANLGEYKKALEAYLKTLDIRKFIHGGENHADIANSYKNIGIAYEKQGQYTKALKYYSKSLEIRVSVSGNSHLETAEAYDNIGDVYYTQGEDSKALEYYSKSLDIRKSAYGEDHPSTTFAYDKIGEMYRNQREYEKALEYHLKSLRIRISTFGENHLEVASSYINIGFLYKSQKKYSEALESYLKAVEIKTSVNGRNHPEVARTFHNIGLIFQDQREYEKALEYYFNSLDIRKSVSGYNHTLTANTYNNIGNIYYSQNKYSQALESYLKSWEIYKFVYGDNYHDAARPLNNIALVYKIQGEYHKALECYLKYLDVKKNVCGENHSDTADCYRNIANVYDNQDEYSKALEYYLKALEIYKSVYEDNHSDVADSYQNIANIYEKQREYSKALEYYLLVLHIKKAACGENHAETADCYRNIANVYDNQDEYSKALEYYLKALEIYNSVYEYNHFEIAASYTNIGLMYGKLGDREKIMEYGLKVIAIGDSIVGENHPETIKTLNYIKSLQQNSEML